MTDKLSRRAFLEHGLAVSAGIGLTSAATAAAAQEKAPLKVVRLDKNEKLRLAILGCGNRSPAHIGAANRYADDYEIVALCDVLPEKLEEKKKLVTTGEPRLYTDYEKMLAEGDDIHAVAVVLPNTLHRDGTVASLEAGKHVLCEKPLTLTLGETRDIIAASDRTGRVVQVGTQSRHAPGYQVLAQKIHDGLIGEVLYGWAQTFRNDWIKLYPNPEEDSRKNWRMKQSEGGSVVYEMGIHTIDVFNWLINSHPVEITALGGTHNKKLEKRDSWDHASVVVRYDNGALLTYGGNLYAGANPGPDFLYGDERTIEIGGRGAREATVYRQDYWRPYGQTGARTEKEVVELPPMEADPSILQYAHFLKAVQGEAPPFPSARDHMPAVLIARASQLSQAEGRHIKASEVS